MNARMDHGRWVVDCAADDCRAVLFPECPMFPEDNYGTLSLRCLCNDVSVCDHPSIPCGVPIEATFPTDRLDIDRLMNQRPRKANRNWETETVAELKAENLLHGVGI